MEHRRNVCLSSDDERSQALRITKKFIKWPQPPNTSSIFKNPRKEVMTRWADPAKKGGRPPLNLEFN